MPEASTRASQSTSIAKSQAPPLPPQRQVPGQQHDRHGAREKQQRIARSHVFALVREREPQHLLVSAKQPGSARRSRDARSQSPPDRCRRRRAHRYRRECGASMTAALRRMRSQRDGQPDRKQLRNRRSTTSRATRRRLATWRADSCDVPTSAAGARMSDSRVAARAPAATDGSADAVESATTAIHRRLVLRSGSRNGATSRRAQIQRDGQRRRLHARSTASAATPSRHEIATA